MEPCVGLEASAEVLARRYDSLAPVFRVVEVLFGMPPGLRRRAVYWLELTAGDRVTEIGCGSGRNLALLTKAVGSNGAVEGIDLSPGMLTVAQKLIARHEWVNVNLEQQDAVDYAPADPVDAVLFSLSYTVIPDRRTALKRAWQALRPGGRLVIMDACLPDGRLGRALRPVALALSQATVLGDPDVRAWEELAALGEPVNTQRLWLGTYVITGTRKAAG